MIDPADSPAPRYRLEIAPGCHAGRFAPIIVDGEDISALLDRARRSDRLRVVDAATGKAWIIPQQNDPRHGAGRFGRGITVKAARALGWRI
jgi:transposase